MVARPLRRLKLAEYNNNLLFSRARCSPMPWPAVEGFCRALATHCPVIEDVKRQHHGIPTRRTTPARPGGSVAACLRDGQTGNSEGGVSISIHHCLIYRFPKKRHTPAGTMKAGVLPMDGPGASHHPRPILGGRLGLAIAGEHRTTGLVLDEAVPRGPYEFPNLLHGPDRQHIS